MEPDRLLAEFRSGLQDWEKHAGRLPRGQAYVWPLYIPVHSEAPGRREESWLAWIPVGEKEEEEDQPERSQRFRKAASGRIELIMPLEEIYRANKRVPAQIRTLEMMEDVEARRQGSGWDVILLASLFSAISREVTVTRDAYHVICGLGRELGLAERPSVWSRLMWATLPAAAPERYRAARSASGLGLVAGADASRVLKRFRPARLRLDPRPARRFTPEDQVRARLSEIGTGRPAPSTLPWNAMTRDELAHRVWTNSLTELSREFGISVQRLYRVCESLGVKAPPRGYWHSNEARRKIMRHHNGIDLERASET